MNYLSRYFSRQKCIFRIFKPQFNNNSVRTFAYHNKIIATSAVTNLQRYPVYYGATRCKSKKVQHDSDDEDEENYNDDSSLSRDSKVVKMNTTSLRTDLVLKQALGIARNKIEQHFYESKIRVNGKKILKKSASVKIGDEIDIIKMVSPKNPDHLYVYRVEIMNVAAKDESINITARRFKNLLIENYQTDPYKGHVQKEQKLDSKSENFTRQKMLNFDLCCLEKVVQYYGSNDPLR